MTIFRIVPCTLAMANDLVENLHRHHKRCVGHRFSLAAFVGDKLVGAAICGRPVSRKISQYNTVEVLRLVTDGTPNTCSFLYARCARVAKEMGFTRIQTYILDTEPGTSLVAAGWWYVGVSKSPVNGWQTREGRRNDQPQCHKQKWVKDFR
jgi:hypothetical protein